MVYQQKQNVWEELNELLNGPFEHEKYKRNSFVTFIEFLCSKTTSNGKFVKQIKEYSEYFFP
jgi:hypothetical protein